MFFGGVQSLGMNPWPSRFLSNDEFAEELPEPPASPLEVLPGAGSGSAMAFWGRGIDFLVFGGF